MRPIFASIVCTCMLSTGLARAAGPANADFETGTFEHWRTHMPPPFFRVTSDVVHNGQFALRGQGSPGHRYNGFAFVVQPLKLTPVPGARYRIAGHARAKLAPGKKRVQLAVREVDADGKTIRYAGPHIKANTSGWRRYSHAFRASDGAVAFQVYIILSDLEKTDVVHFDDIGFDCLSPVKAPVTVQPKPFDPSRPPVKPQGLLRLASSEMEAAIDGTTGLLHSLTLREPDLRALHPAAEAATCVFLQKGDRELRFTVGSGEIKRQGQPGAQTVVAHLSAELPLRATLTYRMTTDRFEEQVVFEADRDIDGLCRLGLRHGFVPEQWQRIICALRPVRTIAAGERTIFCYNGLDRDLCRGRLDRWQSVTYPLTVLEGDDRFVLVGNLSADCFATFAPNEPQGYFPSVQQNPFRIRKGDRFTFSLVYKVLPKETHLLRDAWRWFAARFRSENPLLRDCLPYAPPYPPRTLPEGCHASASGHYTKRGLQIDTRRTIPGSNIWYFGWHDWIRERYPTNGSWWAGVAGWSKTSAEPFRAELQRHRDAGFKCYLYFRQIANLSRADLPASWVKKAPGGALELYGGGYFKALPKKVAQEVGSDEIRWGTYNFDTHDFRRQYLSQVKSCMSYYQPAGVAWDMGWRPGHSGILAVQAATYRWLRQQYPTMRVISNEASGTPTQFFSDAILVENGIVYGKSWYDYEVSKAFNTYCATLERPEFFVRLADGILSGKRSWPWREGAADAKRFIDHLTSTSALASIPADQRNREVAFRANVRAGLRDLAMGSNWGYADMTQLAFGRQLPEALIQFMSEIPAIPTITRSYALRLNGKSDRDGDLYGAGWCDSTRLRLAVCNDSTRDTPFSLFVNRQTLSEHGWPPSAPHERRTYALATDGTARRAPVEWRGTLKGLSIRASLPAFTLLILSADVE